MSVLWKHLLITADRGLIGGGRGVTSGEQHVGEGEHGHESHAAERAHASDGRCEEAGDAMARETLKKLDEDAVAGNEGARLLLRCEHEAEEGGPAASPPAAAGGGGGASREGGGAADAGDSRAGDMCVPDRHADGWR